MDDFETENTESTDGNSDTLPFAEAASADKLAVEEVDGGTGEVHAAVVPLLASSEKQPEYTDVQVRTKVVYDGKVITIHLEDASGASIQLVIDGNILSDGESAALNEFLPLGPDGLDAVHPQDGGINSVVHLNEWGNLGYPFSDLRFDYEGVCILKANSSTGAIPEALAPFMVTTGEEIDVEFWNDYLLGGEESDAA